MMTFHYFVFVTSTLLISFLVKGQTVYGEYEYEDYNDEYEEYEYEEDTSSMEEVTPMSPPEFKSPPQLMVIKVGDPFKLPCLTIPPPRDAVIVWKHGNTVKAVGDMVMDEEFYVTEMPDGNYLANLQAKPYHQGDYICEIAVGGSTPIQLTHTVEIIGELEVMHVNKGDSFTMTCRVTGPSVRSLFWKRIGRQMPDGRDYIQDQESVTFESVTREHVGEYTCENEDQLGEKTVTTHIKLEVNYPPEIEEEDKVFNTKFGGSVKLTCTVNASPNATVTWRKGEEVIYSETPGLHQLQSITKEMLGIYECNAANQLGIATRQFKVLGMASQAHVWSNSKSPDLTKHTLKWTVNSFSPVTQCKVWVQREGDQDWTEHLTDMVPLINWGSIGSFNGKLELDNLKAGEKYLIKIASSNSFGYNEPNKTFSFRTKSTDLGYRSSFPSKAAKKVKKRVKPFTKRKKSSAIIWSSSESKYMTRHFLKWMVNTDSPISKCNVTVKMESEEDWTRHEVDLKPLLPGSKINSFVGKLSLQNLKPGTKYQFMILTKETDVDQKGQQVFSFSTKKEDPSTISSKKRFKVKKFVTSVLSKWENTLRNVIFG